MHFNDFSEFVYFDIIFLLNIIYLIYYILFYYIIKMANGLGEIAKIMYFYHFLNYKIQ